MAAAAAGDGLMFITLAPTWRAGGKGCICLHLVPSPPTDDTRHHGHGAACGHGTPGVVERRGRARPSPLPVFSLCLGLGLGFSTPFGKPRLFCQPTLGTAARTLAACSARAAAQTWAARRARAVARTRNHHAVIHVCLDCVRVCLVWRHPRVRRRGSWFPQPRPRCSRASQHIQHKGHCCCALCWNSMRHGRHHGHGSRVRVRVGLGKCTPRLLQCLRHCSGRSKPSWR